MHARDGTSAGETAARHQLAHDLRSSIRAIAIYADMAERGLKAPAINAAELETYCDGIITATNELSTLVDGFAESPPG